MKKIFLGIVTTMLLIGMMLPLSANAATLELGKTEMKVKDIVEVTVTLDNPAEEFQFDLKFDSQKYQYVNESAKSELDSTHSNLIANDVVRVSALDLNGKTTKTATLQFKATNTGTNIPFSIVGNVAEVNGVQENFTGVPILVKEIGKNSTKSSSSNAAGQPGGETQYVGEGGQPILTLPQTGDETRVGRIKSISGEYKKLISGESVVPYALPNSDTTLSVADVKSEFGDGITGLTNDPVKTGDSFDNTYTIIIYGDVNGDGKVTTFDALSIRKAEKGYITLDNYKSEAADVKNDAIINTDDVYAVQNFVLGLRVTNTDTIIDAYPTEVPSISVQAMAGSQKDRYTDISLAMISSSNDVEIKLSDLGYIVDEAPNGVDKSSVIVKYEEVSAGIYEMKLYATVAGSEYKITPTINGNKVPNGQIKGDQVSIIPEEVYTVTDISISGEGVDSTGNISLKAGKTAYPDITYLHVYKDVQGNILDQIVVPDNKANLTASNVKLTVVNDNNALNSSTTKLINLDDEPVEVDASGAIISGGGKYIDSIRVDATTAGNATLKLSVVDVSFEKTINVVVADKARTTDILENGQVVTKIDTSLYTFDPSSNNVVELGGLYYTIIPLTLRDEDGASVNIQNTAISKVEADNLVVFEEIANPKRGTDLACLGFTATDETDANGQLVKKYTAITNTTLDVDVDAIGIAFARPTNESSINRLCQGITLRYNGLDNSGNVIRKSIPINITLQSQPVTTEVDDEERVNTPEISQKDVENEATAKSDVKVIKVDITAPVVTNNELDYTDAKLTVTMSDGTIKNIALTEDMVKLSEYNKDSEEPQEITGTITYEGKTYTFVVTLEGKTEKPTDSTNSNTTVGPDISNDLDKTDEENVSSNENEISTEDGNVNNTKMDIVVLNEVNSENNV